MASNPAGSLRRNRGLFIVVFLACTAVFVGTLLMQSKALTKETAQAAGHARAISNEIDGLLGTKQLDVPIDAKTAEQLDARLRHALAGGGTVMAVRLWTPGGELRYSSLPKDQSLPIQETLSESTRGVGKITSVVDGEVMTTYVPLRTGPDGAPFGAVEVQASYTPVIVAAASPWTTIRLVASILGGLMLLLIAVGLLAALPARRAAKAGAGFVGARDPNTAPTPSVEEFQRMHEELGEAGAVQRTLEGELERVNARLAADNERATTRVTQLQDELGRAKAKLQEAQVAVSARQAPTADEEELAGWKTRAEASEKKAIDAEHRAQMAEMRVGELSTQLRDAEARLAQTADGEAGPAPEAEPSATPQPSIDPDLVAQLETANVRLQEDLQSALERARAAEDLAASLNDQILTAAAQPPTAGGALSANLDAIVASAQATAESDDDEAGSLRSRLARAADRKRRPAKDESEWPD